MSRSAPFQATAAALRNRAAEFLPFYALAAAVPAVGRVFVFLALFGGYLHLVRTGQLAPVIDALTGRELDPPDPNANPEAFQAWVDGFATTVEPLFTPTVVGLLLLGGAFALVATLLLLAVSEAARFGAVAAVLRGEPGALGGVGGVRRHWLTYLGLYLAETLVWVLATAVVVLVSGVAGSISEILGVLAAVVLGLLWLVAVVLARALFALARPAVAVDRCGLLDSLRASWGFMRAAPAAAIGYFAIAVIGFVAAGLLGGILVLVDTPSVVGPVVVLVLVPVLELAKTALFLDHRDSLARPDVATASLRSQFVGALRRGLREAGGFVRSKPSFVALSAAAFALGLGTGWVAASPFVGALEASIVDRLGGHFPPAVAIDFFANNWMVAIVTSLSGLAGSIPAAVSLWYNGAAIGALAHLEADPAILAAFLLPHGLFEIPALIVSGALGLSLGVDWLRTWLGAADRAALADAIERAFWVLVGVGVLLAVAGLLEGFVSPYYWRLFL